MLLSCSLQSEWHQAGFEYLLEKLTLKTVLILRMTQTFDFLKLFFVIVIIAVSTLIH